MNAGDRLDTLAGMWAVNPPTAFAFDFETSSVNPYAAHIVGISIAFMWGDDLVSEYFPIAHEQPLNTILGWHSGPGEWEPHPENIEWSVVVAALGPYFANPAILKIAHNAKYDLTVGRRNGLEVVSVYDTLLSAWCLGSWSRYGLKYLVQAIFQHQMVEFTDLTTYKVGRKQMSRPFAQVEFVRAMMYGMEDAYWTFRLYEYLELEYAKRPNVRPLFEMENRLMGIVADMEANGILVDVAYLREFKQALDDRIAQLEAQLNVFGVSAYSPQSVAGWYVANGCRLDHYGSSRGKNGHFGVAADILERIARDLKCRPEFRTVALAVNECRTLSKLRSTYVDSWMGAIGADGRIHATFDQRGAGTGRFSCVSGDTLLPTSRGTFRFDEYIPQAGDLVFTHLGAWKPVIRKIYKGESPMVRVGLTGGNVIKCTGEHKVLTPTGWQSVSALRVGDKVYSYVSEQAVRERSWECPDGVDDVPGVTRQTYYGRNCECSWCGSTECASHFGTACGWRTAEGGKSLALFAVESSPKPYAGQEWRPTSQLQGLDRGWTRLSHAESRRQVCVGASAGVCSGIGYGGIAALVGDSSYRWGQDEQSSGQFGASYSGRAWQASRRFATITEITPVGTLGVWDIEVADHHSYAAAGFLNHNSSGPNLQNVPAFPVLGKHMRKAVIAPPGFKLVSIDYSQIELRTLAHICGDDNLCDAFWHDRDVHTATAAAVYGIAPEQVSKAQRQNGKTLNFAIAYGGGPGVIQVRTGMSRSEAQELYDTFKRTYPGITRYMNEMVDFATATGYIETYLGRRVYVGKGDDGRAYSTVAVNSPIQGSAADIIKLAMVRIQPLLEQYGADLQLVMQVHDELVFYIHESVLAEVVPQLVDAMETVVELSVPLRVDAEAGDNWYDVVAMDGIEHAPFDVGAAQVRMLI